MTIKEPPRTIPGELLAGFTLNGAIPVEDWYSNDSYPPDKPRFYDRRDIDRQVVWAAQGRTGCYGRTDVWLYRALARFPIKGLEVAIMGSALPWYESVCLAFGGKPTTIEYNAIATDHPDLTVRTVAEFDRSPRQFDAAFSISSFEHDGLGRYGDPLNPSGDLEAMRKMRRTLKPGGLLYLAVPVAPLGVDRVVWNAHRIYGRRRLPMLLEGWETLAAYGYYDIVRRAAQFLRAPKTSGYYQPVFVLKNRT